MSEDIGIYESGSGGELVSINKNLILSDSFLQNIYLSLFGGNIEGSTENSISNKNVENLDYWANSLIYGNKKSKQFNSRTEKVLSETALSSSGRLKIQRSVEEDLSTLSKLADLDIAVSIPSTDKVVIGIKVSLKGSDKEREFQFVWQPKNINIIDYRI